MLISRHIILITAIFVATNVIAGPLLRRSGKPSGVDKSSIGAPASRLLTPSEINAAKKAEAEKKAAEKAEAERKAAEEQATLAAGETAQRSRVGRLNRHELPPPHHDFDTAADPPSYSRNR